MATELLIILALVLVNGLFAGAEIAVLSVRKTRVDEQARAGHRRARAVQALRDQPERFLATVQIGITVVGSAAAAFGGASIAVRLAPILERVGMGSYAEEVAFASVVAFVAFLSLVLGELVPKSLALRYSDGYAFLVGRPLLLLSRFARPVVWFLTACSNLVLRVFGDRTSFTEARLSRDELQQLVREAATVGAVDRPSSEIATRALTFGDVRVAEVMVPRERIVGLRRDASPDEVQRKLLGEGHSRMPVYDGDLDRVVGYVVALDVLAVAWEHGLVVLDDIIRPIYAVPEITRIAIVLREMQSRRVQMAIVVDEHGAVSGLVTIEDLIEELVGDIVDENETVDEIVQQQPDGSVLVPGWALIRKVNRTLGTDLPIGRDSTTVAGLCMALSLAIPQVGTRVAVPDGTVLEIVDATPRRVRLVRLHRRSNDAIPTPSPVAQ